MTTGKAVYDPALRAWSSATTTYPCVLQDWWRIHPFLNDAGVLSYLAAYWQESLARWPQHIVNCDVYDARNQQWAHYEFDYGETDVWPLWIEDATVHYEVEEVEYLRGYDHASGWRDAGTTPMACFHAGPSGGSAPLLTWFTDQSIGATSWSWDFGGDGSSSERSPYHEFSVPGLYQVTQSVVGPAGSDAASAYLGVCEEGQNCSYWIDPAGGDFENVASWTNGIPGAEKAAIFNLHSAGYPVMLNADLESNGLWIADDIVDLDLNGFSVSLPNWQSAMPVAYEVGDHGTLHIHGGGQISTTGIGIGRNDAAIGQLSVSGADTFVDVDGMVVGTAFGARGFLNITEGGTVRVGHEPDAAFHIAWGSWYGGGGTEPAEGTVVVSGPESALILDYYCDIGIDGIATLRVEDGALFEAINCGIAGSSAAEGTVVVTGAGSRFVLNADHGLVVGNNGRGELLVEAGATLTDYATTVVVHVGTYGGSIGELTITDPNSALMAPNVGIRIGSYPGAHGTMTIANGGYVLSADGGGSAGVVGRRATAVGEVLVTGTGSLWEANGSIRVGNYGTGTVTIDDGGAITSTDTVIGKLATGLGEVSIDGSASSWTCTEQFVIGEGGTGVLSLADNGRIVASQIEIGIPGQVFGMGQLQGTVGNRGLIAPGRDIGTLLVDGDYTQRSEGMLSIELGGPVPGFQYDMLYVTGSAAIAGELRIELVNGYEPPPGQQFTVLTAADLTGTFYPVSGPCNVRAASTPAGVVLTVLDACLGDIDTDGDIDPDDFELLAGCMDGPELEPPPDCDPADLDGDSDVDLTDFARFQHRFGGV